MDSALVKLWLIGLPLLGAGVVKYMAVSLADGRKHVLRLAGVVFGAGGILLTAVLLFWPLISLLAHITGESTGIVSLFKPLLVGAAVCTLGSATTLVAIAFAARRSA